MFMTTSHNFILLLSVSLVLSSEDRTIIKSKLVKKLKTLHRMEGNVRLVGGKTRCEGNVEIFHRGEWGSICDDEWDLRDAKVICNQLRYGKPVSVTHNSKFGHLEGKFFMDNIYCSGNESKITECPFDGWGKNDCDVSEVAGVVCSKNDSLRSAKIISNTSPGNALSDPKVKLKEQFKLRLAGGRNENEGRVEIYTKGKGWGRICGNGWSLLEAGVVCNQLSLGYALMAIQDDLFHGNSGTLAISGVECKGNEKSITECLADVSASCPEEVQSAGVICSQYIADLELDKSELIKSAYLEDRPLYLLQCAMEENCLSSTAYQIKETSDNWLIETRRLLRFTASIINKGNSEFRPFLPKELWQFHQCHMHFHSMEVFATFNILSEGTPVAEGHKASFCLEDNRCLGEAKPQFACANFGDQGISVNCSDVYKHNIDCQWVDISDLLPGNYKFKVVINPDFKVPEMTFENNAVVCDLYYGPTHVNIYNCIVTRP